MIYFSKNHHTCGVLGGRLQISMSLVHRWKLISGLGRGTSRSGPPEVGSEIQHRGKETISQWRQQQPGDVLTKCKMCNTDFHALALCLQPKNKQQSLFLREKAFASCATLTYLLHICCKTMQNGRIHNIYLLFRIQSFKSL